MGPAAVPADSQEAGFHVVCSMAILQKDQYTVSTTKKLINLKADAKRGFRKFCSDALKKKRNLCWRDERTHR
jgi:hypothetical protein